MVCVDPNDLPVVAMGEESTIYHYPQKFISDNQRKFVCEYFKGELFNDKVETLFDTFRNDLNGVKNMKRGGADQSTTKKVKASELTAGMKVQLKNGSPCEVVDITESELGDGLSVSVKLEDGKTTSFNVTNIIPVEE